MILFAALLLAAQTTPPTTPQDAAPAAMPSPAASPTAATLPPVAPGFVRVALTTSEGRIILDLEAQRAPVTTANFLRYVDQHRLDGTVFYRTVRPAPDFGFIQFGVQGDPRRMLPPMAHEPSTVTGVRHTDGAIDRKRHV